MFNDKFNYTLNGIEHEIILNNKLNIDQKTINDKILVSNKYLIKYINDLFDYHSIEYCLISKTLLGCYIFNGINIFNSKMEICTLDSNFFKLKKIEEDIKKDGFEINIEDNLIKISVIFFDNIKVVIFIYPLINELNEDILKITNKENEIYYHQFYDIFPIKKIKYEEFYVSIPNKIDKVLITYKYDLNYIIFSNKKKGNKEIIEESNNMNSVNKVLNENINNFISTIKPFFFY